MEAKARLIVALDVATFEEAEKLIDVLADEVEIFKVGIAPFTAFGQPILDKLASLEKKVFLDLKVHDIPNTVANAARAAVEKGVFMMNFHCLGGQKMLEAAVKAVKGIQSDREAPILLGVTILTSMNEDDCQGIGLRGRVEDNVLELARTAKTAKLDGVVASAREARMIKDNIGNDFVIVTPGVRPEWAAKGDQQRVLTPKAAISEGADYIVVGRPILQADDPADAARKIIEEMA